MRHGHADDRSGLEDTKMRALDVRQAGGGPAATGIVAAAKLGVSSGFVGVLSDDSGGQFLKEDFLKYGVDVSGIEIKSDYRSFTSYIWLNQKQGSRTCVFDKGTLSPLTLSETHKAAIIYLRQLWGWTLTKLTGSEKKTLTAI